MTFSITLRSAAFVLLSLLPLSLNANDITRSHGYHPYGKLKYPADFTHFDYVNPNAPKGGTVRLYGHGTFDSLNPYILKGITLSKTPGLFMFGVTDQADSLLMGSQPHNPLGDEAGAAYGLIAEWIEYPEDRSWSTFRLRKEARFHDGKPIRAKDVVYTFNLLKTKGDPQYALKLAQVESVEALNEYTVKFTFSEGLRNLPLVVGSIPILPKHFWRTAEFEKTTLTPPVSSGPYRIAHVDAGKRVVLERVKTYWARDLSVNRGRFNFDRIEVHYFRDDDVGFESFKAGGYDLHYEYSSKRWSTAYDFSALEKQQVLRAEIPHQMPRPTQAFFFNTRRPPFDDLAVRKAAGLLFDFEWSNRNLFAGAYTRTVSWFPNSPYQANDQASDKEKALFESLDVPLPEHLFHAAITPPVNSGNGQIRNRMQEALALLHESGWELKNGVLSKDGKPLRFTVFNYHNPGIYRILAPWFRNLKRIGIEAEYREVELASYKTHVDRFDYDVVLFVLPVRDYPGTELLDYFNSNSASINGSRNLAGIRSPLVDALIRHALSASDEANYRLSLQALDRVLRYQHYGVLNYHIRHHRLAWWDKFSRPAEPMPYGLGLETWWMKQE